MNIFKSLFEQVKKFDGKCGLVIKISLILVALLVNACSWIKPNKEHDKAQDISGLYYFSSISIESNDVDLSKYRDLSKDKIYIDDYYGYATDLDAQKEYDEFIYDEISRIININKDLDEYKYVKIAKNYSKEKDYIMYSNFWLFSYMLHMLQGNYDEYLAYSFDDCSEQNENNYFFLLKTEYFFSMPFRKKEDLSFTHIEDGIVIDYSYSVMYLEKTIIFEGDDATIEDLSPLEQSIARYTEYDKLIKTIVEYWVPYHEIMRCKIYFKKDI